MNLYLETVELLNKQTQHTKSEIARQSEVSVRWLGYLASGEKSDYSVTKVQRVYDFLTKTSKKDAA